MAPIIIEVSKENLEAFNSLGIKYKLRNDLENSTKQIVDLDGSNWIVIPHEFTNGKYSLEIDPARLSYNPTMEKVGKELGLKLKNTSKDSLGREFIGNNNWFEFLKVNLALGNKTPTIEEEKDFLKLLYLGSQSKIKVYDVSGKQVGSELCGKYLLDVVEVKSPWRAEYLDADFKVKNEKLYINYNHISDSSGNLVPQNSEVLDEDTLMEDKTPGVSLDDWLNNPTKQGLPRKNCKEGGLYYWYPRSDNNSVASFLAYSGSADFCCSRDPSYSSSDLGVRAAKQRE